MNSKEIRKQFIEFFQAKNHTFVRSSPVAPLDDPTLLFTKIEDETIDFQREKLKKN